jgi:hypothetical protein
VADIIGVAAIYLSIAKSMPNREKCGKKVRKYNVAMIKIPNNN